MVRIYSLIVALIATLSDAPAAANQWVTGHIDALRDYTAFNSGSGIYVSLSSVVWGSGSPADGPTQCSTYLFRLAVGLQGVTADIQNRMYATLLTTQATNQNIILYVDTTATAPQCAIQIVMTGEPLQ